MDCPFKYTMSYSCSEVDSSLVFPLKANIWWFFVKTYAKTFQLMLDEFLVPKRLQNIQYNEDEIASASNCWQDERNTEIREKM